MVTEKDGSKDPEKRMVEQGQIDEILASLKALTTTNQILVQEVAELKKDNIELKKKGESRVSRVEANKAERTGSVGAAKEDGDTEGHPSRGQR